MKLNLQPGGLGDELAMTLVPRALREQKGETYVCLGSGFRFPELFDHNPWVDPYRESEKSVEIVHSLGWDQYTLPRKFGKQLGVDVGWGPPEIFLTDAELAEDFDLPAGKCVVAIDTYSTWGTRRWPLERFRRVASVLLGKGVFVVEVGKHRQRVIPSSANYRDRLTVRQTAALLSKCSLFLGNDSGLAHLAAAVDIPQVVVYGVVRAKRRAYASTTPVESGEICDPGCRFKCVDGFEDKEGARCLSQVGEADVLSAVASAIESKVGKNTRRA